jgi:hypothetical protein
MKAIALAVIVVGLPRCLLFSQLSPVPYGSNTDGPGQTFSSKPDSTVFPGKYSSIQKVDFRNLRYPDLGISLKNGHYRHDKPGDQQEVDLDGIHYLNSPLSSSRVSALVLSSWSAVGGSSSQGEQARVFTVSGWRLRLVQVIAWSTHSGDQVAKSSFDAAANVLLIRSDHYIPGDAHCCISAVDVVTFRWDGTRFVQTEIRTELSDYGKRAGQILPQR